MFEYPLDLHCSQTFLGEVESLASLNTLWIYTALKLILVTTGQQNSLNTLWIYTALKRVDMRLWIDNGLNTLWIYTALKL